MTSLKSLWDIFTDRYSFFPIHPQYYTKKYTRTGIDLSIKYARGTLLDIGCGRMPYKERLLKGAEKYIGLDQPNTAKFYKGKEKPDIFADATAIPLKSNSCNTVIALQVLEHLPEPLKALQEAYRVMSPRGMLILSTIQSYPTHDEPYDYYRYTRFGLEYLVKQARFKVKNTISEGNIFILIEQSFNVYLMLKLKQLSLSPLGKILAILLLPFILVLTLVLNLLSLPFQYIDRRSNFRIVQTLVASK